MDRDRELKMNTVKIGGLIYSIKKVSDLQGKNGNWGQIQYKTCEIMLDDSQSEQLENQTLIHEIVHGILCEAGYVQHEEEQVDRISKILYQVLVDNDFSWLSKKEVI